MNKVKDKMRSSWENKAKSNAYSYVDSSCDQWKKENYYKKGEQEVKDLIIDFFEKVKNIRRDNLKQMNVLDIGCGTGRLTRAMAKYFKKVEGIDISEEMISQSKRDNEDLENVNFSVSNGLDLSLFIENRFDFVFSFIVFQHIPRKSIIINYLKEIHRVLKPNGLVKAQVRGYPGKLPEGLSQNRYRGFNSFYLAISRKKGIPFPVVVKYDTTFGAFFKEKELEKISSQIGFREIEITRDSPRYLWFSGIK